jgi:hypothetical protein
VGRSPGFPEKSEGVIVAGDYVDVKVEQSSGGALNVLAGTEVPTSLALTWVRSYPT